MLFLKKLSIYLFGIINLCLLYLILIQPERIWYWFGLIVVFLFLVVMFMAGRQLPIKEAAIFFSLLFFFILASILFLLIVENIYLKYFIVFLVPLANLFFLELLFGYLYRSHRYQPFSLTQFFEYLSLLSVFFLSSGLFALHVFLLLSFWWLSLSLSIIFFILICQSFWLNKFEIKKYLYYPIIFFIIIFELTSLLTWWPVSYYLKGFCVAIFYFLFINLANKSIKQVWDKKKALGWIIVSLIVVAVGLATARWI